MEPGRRASESLGISYVYRALCLPGWGGGLSSPLSGNPSWQIRKAGKVQMVLQKRKVRPRRSGVEPKTPDGHPRL